MRYPPSCLGYVPPFGSSTHVAIKPEHMTSPEHGGNGSLRPLQRLVASVTLFRSRGRRCAEGAGGRRQGLAFIGGTAGPRFALAGSCCAVI